MQYWYSSFFCLAGHGWPDGSYTQVVSPFCCTSMWSFDESTYQLTTVFTRSLPVHWVLFTKYWEISRVCCHIARVPQIVWNQLYSIILRTIRYTVNVSLVIGSYKENIPLPHRNGESGIWSWVYCPFKLALILPVLPCHLRPCCCVTLSSTSFRWVGLFSLSADQTSLPCGSGHARLAFSWVAY